MTYDSDISSNSAETVRKARAHITASLCMLGLGLALAGCVSNAPPRTSAVPNDPARRALWEQVADRTFFAASEGNLRGSVYFAPNGIAVQAAQDRGVRRLSWTAETAVPGVAGPAICVSGGYHDISAGSGVEVQRNGQAAICAPVSSFGRIRSSKGNVLGLGTIIQ